MLSNQDRREQEAYDLAHANSDVDNENTSIHHTLGKGATQAAQGNHNHDADYSPVGHTHLPVLEDYYLNSSGTTNYTTAGTRVTVAGLSQVISVDATTDVYFVDASLDVFQNTATTATLVLVLDIDGTENPIQIAVDGRVAQFRTEASKRWRVTGLPVGNHTFKIVGYVTAAGSFSTFTHSIMHIEKKI